ncbi:MAG: FMN-binding protein [Candidatus Omnitrophica bacterium]|nr:FMN-binding protein [Candidatus Omnitrophota bacterium]
MREILRYGAVLALICITAAFSLSMVNSFTKAKIIAQANAEEQASLKEVLPQAERFEAVKSASEVIYYKAYDNKGNFIGVAFKASGEGYSSTIDTMVGMTREGTINAIKIISQNETPGLGTRVAEDAFASRFAQKKLSMVQEIEAITGASISSRAVTESVAKKAAEIVEIIKNER